MNHLTSPQRRYCTSPLNKIELYFKLLSMPNKIKIEKLNRPIYSFATIALQQCVIYYQPVKFNDL